MIKEKSYKRLVVLGLALTFIFALSVKTIAQSKSVETTSGVKTTVQSKTVAASNVKAVVQNKSVKKSSVSPVQSKSAKTKGVGSVGYFFIVLIVAGIIVSVIIVYVPIFIAKKRGITGSQLTTVKVLSWISIISFSITWWIALIMALVYKPDNWIGEKGETVDLDRLDRLHQMKEKGILSDTEYEKYRKQILDKND